ncbi:MAG: hypothetical protein A3B82_00060 [Methylophilales bacterium RIFCSPHIGHO2_02_FULL_57_10]|nr:MAG: hypothetical protein A3B82_00060 [Methylophilales bacterium RIFCSPHIGHO2_02_FULL_57_10]
MSRTPNRRAEPVARTSAEIALDQLDRLREVFPGCVSEGKIDFEKLRAALGDEVDARPERYGFTWAGKRDALRLLQTPSRATLIPRSMESVNFEKTNNVFIEGDNLEVLKLLYKAYFNQVKMIYIDPPYNTGNDFIYPDNFADPLDTYLKLTAQKDGGGNLLTSNPETSGRYHSTWLSMMLPRLFVARQLLREEGFIFVSIDDHEAHNLRLLMNEMFGEENFVSQIVWKSRRSEDVRAKTGVSVDHEYILCYRKSEAGVLRGTEKDLEKFANPDNDSRGPWRSADLTGLATKEKRPNLHYDLIDPATGIKYGCPPKGWRFDRQTMQRKINEKRILFPPDGKGRPRHKLFLNEMRSLYKNISSVILEPTTGDGTREVNKLVGEGVFDFPKPLGLIKLLLEQATEEDDLVLDFFAGSGTTGHAVLALNREEGTYRRLILVQLPEPTGHDSPARRLGYQTIAEIGKDRLRRVMNQLTQAKNKKPRREVREPPEDFGLRVFKLAESNYRPWTGVEEKTPQAYAKTIKLFTDPLVPGWKPENVIWEVAIKEGYALNSHIELVAHSKAKNKVYKVTDPDKGQSFRICLDDSVRPATLKELNLSKDDLFICRDSALTDEAAANLALQCRLKTI